jgi:hypothetical protein
MKNALDLTAREAADREYMAKLMSDIDDDIAAGTWVTSPVRRAGMAARSAVEAAVAAAKGAVP